MRSRVIQQESLFPAVENPADVEADTSASAPAPARTRDGAPRARPLRTVGRRQSPDGAASVAAHELWLGAHLGGVGAADTPPDLRTLERLATRSQTFTPRVSLVPPDGLLLEVKGSLHLFNGIAGLSRAFANECQVVGVKPVTALAPTPLAALVASRAGKSLIITDMAQLVGQLTPLPLGTLRWEQETIERLARMGVRTIGQALRLPRAGFAKRFGSQHLAMLDRLTGRDPDLRDPFRARERFRRRRDLSYELESHDGILASLAPLLEDLGKFLEARQCGVMEIECRLQHRNVQPTSCVLRLSAPAANIGRITELLSERLRALTLPEPVRACELRSGALVARLSASKNLWQPGEHGGGAGAEAAELIERLRVRLGPEAVYGLKVLQSHRPENAWGAAEPAGKSARTSLQTPWPAFRRPLWLLSAPQLLSQRDGLPWRRGALSFLSGPERIETGWWDGGEIARDYYMAVDIHGVRLWVFRERAAPHRWFLHGVFG